jgi:hypothetical protein
VRAYKFLRPGGLGPFSGIAWTTDWVVAEDGIYACAGEHLPLWIWEELWEIELDGPVATRGHKLRASRGRLTRRIEGWSMTAAQEFARECARRAALHASGPLAAAGQADAARLFAAADDLKAVRAATRELWDELEQDVRLPMGMASDGAKRALVAGSSDDPYVAAQGGAVAGYIAAMTALRVGGKPLHDAERAGQADWLKDFLELV